MIYFFVFEKQAFTEIILLLLANLLGQRKTRRERFKLVLRLKLIKRKTSFKNSKNGFLENHINFRTSKNFTVAPYGLERRLSLTEKVFFFLKKNAFVDTTLHNAKNPKRGLSRFEKPLFRS